MLQNIKEKKTRVPINTKSGFTVPEILVGISIFVLVVGALTLFSRNVWVYQSYVSTGLSDVNNGRSALKTITYEIRGASTADTGVYVVALATPTAFTFYSDIDDDGLKERVRYFLNGSQLQKGVIKPTGSPLSYNPANEKISTLIPNVVNSAIFEYYDENYDGTTVPLISPIILSSVRLIKITINIDKDPNRAPVTTVFSTQVSIRNLKDNL